MLLDQQQEVALGEQSANEILQSSKLSDNAKQKAMVNRVGQKIAAVADRPDFKWEFYLL